MTTADTDHYDDYRADLVVDLPDEEGFFVSVDLRTLDDERLTALRTEAESVGNTDLVATIDHIAASLYSSHLA